MQVSDMYCASDSSLAAAAGLIEKQSTVAQLFVNLGQAATQLFGFKLEQTLASLCGITLRFQIRGMLGQLLVFCFALQLFGGGTFDLRRQRVNAFAHLGKQRFDPLQNGGGRTVTFFEGRDASRMLRRRLGRFFAVLAENR